MSSPEGMTISHLTSQLPVLHVTRLSKVSDKMVKMIIFSLLLLLLSRFSRVRLCATPWMAAHQAPPSLDSPGKNTGMGCHFLLQCIKVKSESEVAQSCPTLCDPMDCSLPVFSVHGIFQARVLKWGPIAFSDLQLSCIQKSIKYQMQSTKVL